MVEIAPEKVEELKNEHKGLWTLIIPLDDDGTRKATCYLRKLDRQTYNVVSKMVANDPLTAIATLINTLWVAGDDAKIITDDFDALRCAADTCIDILKARTGELKKN